MKLTMMLSDYILKTREERTAHIDLNEPCDNASGGQQRNKQLFTSLCRLLRVECDIANRVEAKIDVCHLCRSEKCRNPKHAYLGTRTENIGDISPDKRSERIRKGHASKTPKERSDIARRREGNKTPEQRSETARKGQANRDPEERSRSAREAQARRTPEQRSDAIRRGWETRRLMGVCDEGSKSKESKKGVEKCVSR
jgi:hypothetical protein